MTTANGTKGESGFENVEFVEPVTDAETPGDVPQPSHPFTDTENARKRKHEASATELDEEHEEPASKRAKHNTDSQPQLQHSVQAHRPRTKPPNYYQKKLRRQHARHAQQPTLQEMQNHELFKIAKQHWLVDDDNDDDNITYDATLTDELYHDHISAVNDEYQHNIAILEFSHYLETYLWRFFDPESCTREHLLSMLYCINEKFNQDIPVWEILLHSDDAPQRHANEQKLSSFFDYVFQLKLTELQAHIDAEAPPPSSPDDVDTEIIDTRHDQALVWSVDEKSTFLQFLVHCFYKMEHALVRTPVLKLVALPLYEFVDEKQRDMLLTMAPSLNKLWRKFTKNKSKLPRYQLQLYYCLLREFLIILRETESLHKLLADTTADKHTTGATAGASGMHSTLDALTRTYNSNCAYIYQFAQLVIDNLCLLTVRRYLRPFLQSPQILFLIQCKHLLSPLLYKHDRLYQCMIDKIEFYLHFEIDDMDGRSLTDNEMRLEQAHKFVVLQKCVYRHFYRQLHAMALSTIASMDNYAQLKQYLRVLGVDELYALCAKLHLVSSSHPKLDSVMASLLHRNDVNHDWTEQDVLVEILAHHHLSRPSQRDQIQQLPLYPTEKVLFDDTALRLNVDKLNLQFLTVYDYLLRNYNLYRLESAYSVRDDLAKCIWKIRPRLQRNPSTKLRQTVFTGYSRMAVPLASFCIVRVNKPHLGEEKPSKVVAEIHCDLQPFHGEVLQEWHDLREHDVLFLVRLQATHEIELELDQYLQQRQLHKQSGNEVGVGSTRWDELTQADLGVETVRGCHIMRVRDGDNPDRVIGERDAVTQSAYVAQGSKRIFEVELDAAQYQLDITAMIENEDHDDEKARDVYADFNLLVRRKGKENNFKSVLRTITDLMNRSNDRHVFETRSSNDDNNNAHWLLPQWFQPLFLGYDDPQNAAYYNVHKSVAPPNIAERVVSDFDDYTHDGEDDDENDIKAEVPLQNVDTLEYKHLVNDYYCLDFKDTFLDFEHAQRSFTAMGYRVRLFGGTAGTHATAPEPPPYRIWFHKRNMKAPDYDAILKASLDGDRGVVSSTESPDLVVVEAYTCNVEPQPKPGNLVRFTPIQIEAIRSGMHHGLTMVVGPPGSGKTDVAVQIISNLYSNFGGTQRILLVTHSNQALNDLFEKLVQRDIDERHLLRLGFGYKQLQQTMQSNRIQDTSTEEATRAYNFSRQGRIDYMLDKRLENLKLAQYLAVTLGLPEQNGYCHTAETCQHFKNMMLTNLWEKFEDDLDAIEEKYADKLSDAEFVIDAFVSGATQKSYPSLRVHHIIDTLFPFKTFIQRMQNAAASSSSSAASSSSASSPFAANASYAHNKSLACKYWRYIARIFEELQECHVFELLRTSKDRSQFLLTRQSKVVAMTCTHAAIKRAELVQHQFEYDTLIIEEAAQILDIETFIPMVLQHNHGRLKRIILIGDHYQLPPIVRNRTLCTRSKLDQSLFHRLIRLGVPYHLLNMQGRCRPNLRRLWCWNYPYDIGDLPSVTAAESDAYQAANTGFYYDFQFVNVFAELGYGESQPTPYFYQNLDEAEYVVNTFMYMRLLGYPAQRITILTTYNGQKHLLKEIVQKKCVNDPLFGAPAKITTVDKYQGSQNDYVLLSLVRTRSVGHIRDIRRLIVSLSRSKFGLYVFGSVALLQQCYELKQAMNELLRRPTSLQLVTNESYPTMRKCGAELPEADYEREQAAAENAQPSKQSEYFTVESVAHLMHVVNSMADSVRSHFKLQYQARLTEYQDKATAALTEKKRLELECARSRQAAAAKQMEKEEMDVSDEGQDEKSVDMQRDQQTKQYEFAAAKMTLVAAEKLGHKEEEEADGDNESSSDNDAGRVADDGIEFESSSSSGDDEEED